MIPAAVSRRNMTVFAGWVLMREKGTAVLGRIADDAKQYGAAVWGRIADDAKQYGAALAAAALYMIFMNLVFHAFCPLVIFRGIPCPGCGMTRASICFLTGRWQQAWQMNPVVFPFMAAAGYFGWNRYIAGRRAKGMKIIAIGLLVLLIVVYGVRMYLYFPDRAPCLYAADNMIAHLKALYWQIGK